MQWNEIFHNLRWKWNSFINELCTSFCYTSGKNIHINGCQIGKVFVFSNFLLTFQQEMIGFPYQNLISIWSFWQLQTLWEGYDTTSHPLETETSTFEMDTTYVKTLEQMLFERPSLPGWWITWTLSSFIQLMMHYFLSMAKHLCLKVKVFLIYQVHGVSD